MKINWNKKIHNPFFPPCIKLGRSVASTYAGESRRFFCITIYFLALQHCLLHCLCTRTLDLVTEMILIEYLLTRAFQRVFTLTATLVSSHNKYLFSFNHEEVEISRIWKFTFMFYVSNTHNSHDLYAFGCYVFFTVIVMIKNIIWQIFLDKCVTFCFLDTDFFLCVCACFWFSSELYGFTFPTCNWKDKCSCQCATINHSWNFSRHNKKEIVIFFRIVKRHAF